MFDDYETASAELKSLQRKIEEFKKKYSSEISGVTHQCLYIEDALEDIELAIACEQERMQDRLIEERNETLYEMRKDALCGF